MMMKYLLIAWLTGLSLLAIPSLTAAADDTPAVTTDGMELVTKDRRGAIYADPGVDWTVYTAIIL
ncbi:MAG: hypothetical protein KJO72_11130, partial [Gammaproteobacteria bacterium]|nr:hypothetical protein [Gammaproteobacteria bacterium]